ncbi:hypothetical protein [Lentilactobacillus kisonensis]|uniref:DnaD domain protein n=1 Tax=Lentilactobacillus kisonensis F0435 TaxID=797516 RepID=H1LF02_9LACO|nr:hypothetical protein [Lentilactobacillus kisonensis]EHO52241.1 hypothetical protein HMPREF9104_01178 [Lentilactobacillus kisonensis F0435]
MDIFKLIKAFKDFSQYEQPLSTGSVALWYTLVTIDNQIGWKTRFTVTNQMLQSLTGMSRGGVLKARNSLQQCGLIKFTVNGRNKATSYELVKIYIANSEQQRDATETQQKHSGDTPVSHYLNKDKDNKKTSRRNRKKRTYDQNSDYMKLAKFLQKQILINKPDFKQPVLQTWADDMRKLVELDKRDKHDVALVIKWCQQDSFWSTNILSASKLRKQFDQLYLKMKASKGSNPKPRASGPSDFEKSVARQQRRDLIYNAYSKYGNDLDKAMPEIKQTYPDITFEEADKVVNPPELRGVQ